MDTDDETSLATEGGDQTPKERQPTARELAMEAIKVHREGVDDDQQTDQVTLQASEPTVLADGLDRTMVKIKVDGEERVVSVADMVARVQKNEAADKRLAEANALLTEAARRKAELEAQQAGSKPPAQVDSTNTGDDTPATSPAGGPAAGQTVKDFIEALYEGDTEKAATVFQEVMGAMGRGNATPIDPNTLVTELAPAVRQQLADDSALETFLESNPVIANDPHLTQMTAGFVQEGMRGGKAYPDALNEAGERVKQWMAGMGMGSHQGGGTTTPSQTKLDRKAGIDEIRPASITAANTAAPPQTTQDVLNDMRKARGLPV